MARDASTWNGLDAWHRTGSTVSGLCRGWESEHRRDQVGRVHGPPLPKHIAAARDDDAMREIYQELARQAAAGELGPGPIAVSTLRTS